MKNNCPECKEKDSLFPPTYACYYYTCTECGESFDLNLNPVELQYCIFDEFSICHGCGDCEK